jgi:two-component system, OmpR family, sensor histidine kinase SenX3
MDAWALVVVVGVGSLVVGVAIGRRSLRGRVASLGQEVGRMAEALEDRERAAREERRVQDLILGSMQEGVLLFDGAQRTAFANAAFARHLGFRPEALGQLYPPGLREMVSEVARSRQIDTTEIETSVPTRFLRLTAAPAGDDGSVLLVVTDVTESRRVESVRRDFVANASHELKTPAASIQAVAETLMHAAKDDPEAVPRFAAQLEREAVRLSRIVADLLDLSRLESGSVLDQRVRLDAVVRDEGQRFVDAAKEAGLELDLDAPGAPVVLGSARDLSLLVRNLIDNAIRYTLPDGRVRVQVAIEDGGVFLRVEDTGIGIPSRDLPRVFERFYRVDRARSRETGGTGLGLAIVKHVAENHGGSVRVQSELGRGSTFEIRLPGAPAVPTT